MEGMHEQLAHFVNKGGELLKIRVAAEEGFYGGNTLLPDLLKFCREQKAYLYELIELRRMERSDAFDAEKAFRILSHLTVPQLSLFMRMLVEKGIFATKSMAELYRFTASHFYTDRANLISAQSLIRNGQEVDFATAFKLFQVLNGLIDWLDEKFSVRTFRQA